MRTTNRIFLNLILLITLIYYALFAGWYLSYSNYFFFPIIYQMSDVHGNILKYAPQNRQGKSDFVFVDGSVHLKVFAEMLRAVEHEGRGLEDITYPVGHNSKKQFLTREEIVHLQDVADLLSMLRSFWRLMLVIMLVTIGTMIYGRYPPYYMSTLAWSGFFAGGLVWLAVKKFGFIAIFYGMHRMVFPEGHKWLFYYQDSLMSTVLNAPDSFIYFGYILGVFSLVAFIPGYKLLQFILSGAMNKYR